MIIREVRANQRSFRPIRFRSGANIILAERSKESSKKDTRNGLGKSTLLSILSYCLGGSKTGTLTRTQLEGWSFSLDIEHSGRLFSVSRSINEQGAVEVEGDTESWLTVSTATTTLSGAKRVEVGDYKRMLGQALFGLEPSASQKHQPTFRSLAAYYMRQGGKAGGYYSPFYSNRAQTKSEVQVNNAYLLGLNWKLVKEMTDARSRKKRLKSIEKETSEGILEDAIGSAGDLEAIMVRLEDKSQKEIKIIESFKIHKEYSQLEEEANTLTKFMHDLVNKKSVQAKTVEKYRESIKQEYDESPDSVLTVYEESHILFPDSVRRRLEEARIFHESIVKNRRDFLGSEISRLDSEVSAKGRQIDEMGARRAKIMRILETHGAIEELVAIQAKHKETIERKADISSRLGALKKIEREYTAINAGMVRLYEQVESDFDAHKDKRRDAILAFNKYTEMLYSAPGRLSIGMKEGEYSFDVKIERSDSRGIGNMKIFCYDLALASLWAGRPQSPGFLVHDSEVFDGVDERQVALALQTAASESERLGTQYICAINSDTVPRDEFNGSFDFDSRVAVTLTDKGDDGGLLGIRF